MLLHANFAANHANTIWQQQNQQLVEQDTVLICTGGELQLVSLSAWQQTGQLIIVESQSHQTDSNGKQAKCPNIFLDQQSPVVLVDATSLYPIYLALKAQHNLYNQQLNAVVFHAFSARAPPIYPV
ncbi:hypothetical protein ACMZOO_19010 (plasmid) [Catenovulum sp. SX2]|uniref:hypothetical protein n=1 Tax=Catenovulum sp. SX2 TaxID=3398614 RepID=UPI003F82A0F3